MEFIIDTLMKIMIGAFVIGTFTTLMFLFSYGSFKHKLILVMIVLYGMYFEQFLSIMSMTSCILLFHHLSEIPLLERKIRRLPERGEEIPGLPEPHPLELIFTVGVDRIA
ncbi:MAG: hypothetical protein NTX72_01150 [Candidatus Uhrbacteria bacterium]|nr:hypothetical protein [Candidatus Uhrbacteria bacterium]